MINKLKNLIEEKYISLLIFLILLKHLNFQKKSLNLLKIAKRLKIKLNIFKKNKKLKNKNFDNNKDIDNNKRFKGYKEFKNNNGQLSLEFLLISLIVILVFISISLPLAEIAISSTLDLSDSLETKSEILKITGAIDDVYSDGIGSRRVVYIEVPKDTSITFSKNPLSNTGIATADIDLNKNINNTKRIEVHFKANNSVNSLNLRKKSLTKVIVEWTEEGIILK